MSANRTLTITEIVKRLRDLERRWPKGNAMIMANGNFLYLCTKHPEAGGKEIAAFQIPNDGGDPDWGDED